MRRLAIIAAFLLMPTAAFAGCLPTGPAALPCAGAAALNALGNALGSQPGRSGCSSNQHATIDMYGNKGCAPGGLSKNARKFAEGPKPAAGAIKPCPMGSVMARKSGGGTYCKDVPGALHARK